MFLALGESRYMDVLERVLYNGFLSGVGLSGDRFLYVNPLASDGRFLFNWDAERKGRFTSRQREDWYYCPCCPPNVCRTLVMMPQFVYAVRGNDLYVNLFVASTAEVTTEQGKVTLTLETGYPWDGAMRMTIQSERPVELALRIRVPGWVKGHPVPTDLYRYVDAKAEPVIFNVNGRQVETPQKKAYAVIRRTWRNGDTLRWEFPMPIRRVLAHEAVKVDARRWGVCAEAMPRHRAVAVERGPIVYCFEGVDNGGRMGHQFLPPRAKLSAKHRDDLLGGVTVVEAVAKVCFQNARGGVEVRPSLMTAIPYYAWNHRGVGEMTVWVPQGAEAAKPLPAPATGK